MVAYSTAGVLGGASRGRDRSVSQGVTGTMFGRGWARRTRATAAVRTIWAALVRDPAGEMSGATPPVAGDSG